MAEGVITQGAIRGIFQPGNGSVELPVLQCLMIKTAVSQAGGVKLGPRFRVVLSDTQNFIHSMLPTHGSDIVHSGELKKGSIVRLLKFNTRVVQSKNVLVVLELEVLTEFDDHRELAKIGQPEALEVVKSDYTPAVTSSSNFYEPKSALVPRPRPDMSVHQSSPTTSSYPDLYPIEALSPYAHRWTIRVQCTKKGDMKEWSNQKGQGRLFSLTLLDNTGEVRATAFDQAAEKLFSVFEVGVVYCVSTPCKVRLANRRFSRLPNNYELQFDCDTKVEIADDQDNKPRIHFHFTSIGELGSVEKGTTIDTVGVLLDVAEMTTILSKSTAKYLSKRELTLTDVSQRSVRLTIWETTAQTFCAPVRSVVAFKGVKISDFGGRSLSLSSCGLVCVDPDVDEARTLRAWFDDVGHDATIVPYQKLASRAVGNGKMEYKLIAQVLEEEGRLQDTPTYTGLRASVAYVRATTIAYPACSMPMCTKKVKEDSAGSWWCEKCHSSFSEPLYRYAFSMNVLDHTGTLWLSCFDEAGRQLLGISANEAMRIKLNDEQHNTKQFLTIMEAVTRRTFNMIVRASMETYQDQPKPRYQVLDICPLDCAQEANKLAGVIRQYQMSGETSSDA